MDELHARDAQPVELTPELQLGIPEVDEQHRALIFELNRLLADREALPSSDLFSSVLSRLGMQLGAHFAFEESLFGAFELSEPEESAHRAAHGHILAQYAQLNIDLMQHSPVARGEAIHAVRAWIVDHLVTHDLLLRQRPLRAATAG